MIYFRYQTSQNCSITILVDMFQISNKSELQHYHLGSYISNIKQLRIAALQSWLIYFKYQTTRNCSITILVDIFQISNNSELQDYNLGSYILNIKQVRIVASQSWLIYFKYQRTQNCSITMLVVSNTCDALRDLISCMQF